mgnify:CR=1 FL=1
MKRLLLLIPLITLSCSISQVTADRQAINQVKTVAIVPFTSTIKLDSAILYEAEDKFRKTFSDSGFIVIEREKVDGLLKQKEFSETGITKDNIASAGRILGADAVLAGEITVHEEKVSIFRSGSHGGFGMMVFDKDDYKTEYRTYLRFKITITLVNVRDGSVILTMTNRYIETEKDENLPGYLNIDAYRRLTLKKMGKELADILQQFHEQPGASRSSK